MRLGLFFRDAEPEKLFEGAAKFPVITELTEAVKVCLAHIAMESELLRDRVEVNSVLELEREFDTFGNPVELDEVIQGTLHHCRDADANRASRGFEIEGNRLNTSVHDPCERVRLEPRCRVRQCIQRISAL
jgi:hypothetical protein